MIDEGYTKFRVDWTKSGPLLNPEIDELNAWRPPLYAAKLIGHYEDHGVGYGNTSMRVDASRQFLISGTQTGHFESLGRAHYALVTDYHISDNRVSCTGPIQASSESMTHAMIYELEPAINAIVHVHDRRLWTRFKDRMPTTDAAVSYGTPEMALEFARLFDSTDFRDSGIAVMAGHEEGLVSIGSDIESAARRILSLQANET